MTELLAPAGSREALIAAVQNGANAVYLGVDEFNARRSARNFTLDELRGVVAYCHLRGVRVYLTLNTLVNDRELHALSSVAHGASEAGVDAILVQDWGVLDTLRRVAPVRRQAALKQRLRQIAQQLAFCPDVHPHHPFRSKIAAPKAGRRASSSS